MYCWTKANDMWTSDFHVVSVNNWDSDAAEVRKVKCGKNTIHGILTPKKITAIVR